MRFYQGQQIYTYVTFGLLSALAVAVPGKSLSASSSRENYLAALKIADRHVQRQKELEANNAGALSSTIIKRLYGRYYRVGDAWTVAAIQTQPMAMLRTGSSGANALHEGQIGIFRYEVIEVRNGAEPEVVLQVTQQSAHGLKPVDSKVESLTLTMNDKLSQSLKEYKLRGSSGSRTASMVLNGVRSGGTPLELFPLDVPDAYTAVEQQASAVPQLPGKLSAVAQQAGFNPNVSQSTWFEQNDFFGRPIQFLWQSGDPWPAYLKTPHGVSILIGKEGA